MSACVKDVTNGEDFGEWSKRVDNVRESFGVPARDFLPLEAARDPANGLGLSGPEESLSAMCIWAAISSDGGRTHVTVSSWRSLG